MNLLHCSVMLFVSEIIFVVFLTFSPPPPKACRLEYSAGSSRSRTTGPLSDDYSDDETPSGGI